MRYQMEHCLIPFELYRNGLIQPCILLTIEIMLWNDHPSSFRIHAWGEGLTGTGWFLYSIVHSRFLIFSTLMIRSRLNPWCCQKHHSSFRGCQFSNLIL